ncbi:restriction endonuclease subunit S [Aeromonas hydrophila]|uniref:restriction endonuclease subunit S n=1 Tax=Aeromonas hydrophila TaxID=644 RepID=UPI003EC6B8F1
MQLPHGWSSCSLSDIAAVNPKTVADESLIAGFVPMSHAPTRYHGELLFDEKPWGEIKKSYTNFQDGDVIFAKVTPCFENGKAAAVDDLPNGIGAGSSEFYVLRPHCSDISQKLLFALIKTHAFMQEGATNMTGAVGLRRVPKSFVETFPIALPPATEQTEIADRLDILLAQVEATQARLARIPDIIKQFRQSVLAAAVSGKLTKEGIGISTSKRTYLTLNDVGIEVKTGPFGSALHKRDYLTGGIPIINPMHISEGKITPSLNMSISKEKFEELAAWHLRKNDVIIGRRGEMGRAAVVSTDGHLLCGTGSMILRVTDNALPKYLEIILRSPVAVDYFNSSSVGSTMVNLNQKIIKNLKVYFPEIEEQTEIVRRVEKLFAYADTLEQQAEAAKARVDNLTQAILAKAFCGELTADWRAANPDLISGDNSAAALLARIQAERATAKPRKRASKPAISPTSSGVT